MPARKGPGPGAYRLRHRRSAGEGNVIVARGWQGSFYTSSRARKMQVVSKELTLALKGVGGEAGTIPGQVQSPSKKHWLLWCVCGQQPQGSTQEGETGTGE